MLGPSTFRGILHCRWMFLVHGPRLLHQLLPADALEEPDEIFVTHGALMRQHLCRASALLCLLQSALGHFDQPIGRGGFPVDLDVYWILRESGRVHLVCSDLYVAGLAHLRGATACTHQTVGLLEDTPREDELMRLQLVLRLPAQENEQ